MKDLKRSRPSVFGTGLIALDIVISHDSTTPIRDAAGGTCGNVLAALSFLGWDSYPISRLNGDPASVRVKADLRRWGVHLEYAECFPSSATPIIIQQIVLGRDGLPRHRFAWSCPSCGKAWPRFAPITMACAGRLKVRTGLPSVFFMDRLSRAALKLAREMSERGALVMFEPSARCDETLWVEALQVTDVLKYSHDRHEPLEDGVYRRSSVRLEIHTLGADGLRFRCRLGRAKTRGWVSLGAIRAPRLVDTCGAGDWCTAGLLSRIARGGVAGFSTLTRPSLEAAINYGQVLAAWNCAFEGARGGMYEVDSGQFDSQIARIQSGQNFDTAPPRHTEQHRESQGVAICPRCS
jgi:sugar/nucleoside kinase (ribokinase family)